MVRKVAGLLANGQTNYLRGMMLYPKTYKPDAILADHQRPVRYLMPTRRRPFPPWPMQRSSTSTRHAVAAAATSTTRPRASST
jgi:hypothetical protein